jgi:hypothetical protein
VAQPREVGSPVASRNVATGEAFAVGIAEVDLARNVRYASVGLVGLVVGLAALLVRLERDRRRGRSFGVDFLLALEGLTTVIYGQILLIGVYLLVDDTPAGAPLTLDRLGDSLYRALSMIFALIGA